MGHRVEAERKAVTEVRSPYSSLARLEEMLARGWEIEAPVYVRPGWRSVATSKEENTYHFVLWRDNRVSLVSVREGPEIQQFLVDSGLTIDYL